MLALSRRGDGLRNYLQRWEVEVSKASAGSEAAPREGQPSSDAPIVSCSGLHRRFGEGDVAVDALSGVSLEFPKGELTAIVGPSGSGKSTLMHILAGLDRPTSGQVWISGTEITALDDRELTNLRRDKLGFVFQFFNLVPVLTAEENLVLPLKIAGRKVDTSLLEGLLETVNLTDRRNHRPAELSGGQQQRVAIARALITRPAVVFADEPTGNLDSKSGAVVLGLLKRAVDEFGETVVMVSHDPRVASYTDRVIVLSDGAVVHDGKVQSADEVLTLMQGD
ncbi:MAG: ABC transporter ATP-binding protein [Thermoleophilia bacterium]|nr:ABC transporter ATP-binding protein [Thermoleophilia bacterium]